MSLSGIIETHKDMNVTVQCAAAGHPVPTISWFKNGIMLVPTVEIVEQTTLAINLGPYNNPSEGLFGVVGTLTFLLVQVTDSGNYTCSASNSLQGTKKITAISNEINLNVFGK